MVRGSGGRKGGVFSYMWVLRHRAVELPSAHVALLRADVQRTKRKTAGFKVPGGGERGGEMVDWKLGGQWG